MKAVEVRLASKQANYTIYKFEQPALQPCSNSVRCPTGYKFHEINRNSVSTVKSRSVRVTRVESEHQLIMCMLGALRVTYLAAWCFLCSAVVHSLSILPCSNQSSCVRVPRCEFVHLWLSKVPNKFLTVPWLLLLSVDCRIRHFACTMFVHSTMPSLF